MRSLVTGEKLEMISVQKSIKSRQFLLQQRIFSFQLYKVNFYFPGGYAMEGLIRLLATKALSAYGSCLVVLQQLDWKGKFWHSSHTHTYIICPYVNFFNSKTFSQAVNMRATKSKVLATEKG
ncbi:hypothetical protein SDJN03_21452, partial [Cucurbita argyrosperma subsp. sororia]